MDWENEILTAIGSEPSGKKRQRDLSSESEGEYREDENEISDDDPEWDQVKSWNRTDLMGNSADRKRLMAMSELDREMELAERRKKIEALEERQALKNRLKSQKEQGQSTAQATKLTERQIKGQSLEKLRRKRERKAARSRTSGKDRHDDSRKRNAYSDEESDYENEYEEQSEENKDEPKLTLQEALTIQVTRDDIEQWLHKPMFQKNVEGGKEWNRFEVTHTIEKIPMISKNHIKRKVSDIEKLHAHEEINEIIAKKKESMPVGNKLLEIVRLKHAMEAANSVQDYQKVQDCKRQIETLEAMIGPNKNSSEVDLIAQLNARNRERDLKEGSEAEKAALAKKRQKAEKDTYDPFARRKTAPVHIITTKPEDLELPSTENEISKSISLSNGASNEVISSDDEDPFASIDVSLLEQEINSQ